MCITVYMYIWRHRQYELPAFGEANDKVSRYLLSQRKTFIKLVQKASLTRKIRFIITVKSNIILRLLCKKKESKTHRMRLTFQITHIWTRIFYDDSRQASALGVCSLNDVLTNKKLQRNAHKLYKAMLHIKLLMKDEKREISES